MAELRMLVPLVEIDGGDRSLASLRGERQDLAVRIHDVGWVIVSRGDQKDPVLDGARLAQYLIAAPDRHENHLGALRGQITRGIGKKDVVADHQADRAEIGVEHRVVAAGSETMLDLLARQVHFAVLADHVAGAVQEHGGGIDGRTPTVVKAPYDALP